MHVCHITNLFAFLGPLQSAGHTATLVNKSQRPDRMVMIFGHSPRYGHLHTVQEFIFGKFFFYVYFLLAFFILA